MESIPMQNTGVEPQVRRGPKRFGRGRQFRQKCYNCGNFGHIAPNCTSEKKGDECYNCGMSGHIARECSEEKITECYNCHQTGRSFPLSCSLCPFVDLCALDCSLSKF